MTSSSCIGLVCIGNADEDKFGGAESDRCPTDSASARPTLPLLVETEVRAPDIDHDSDFLYEATSHDFNEVIVKKIECT